ncbi:PQQ-dependent oxidoreductase, gdhB family [Roseibacterium elongatum DSM 19469]|uniref:PQQ-dependent oxidoreductase, gdhB family n=1 Tax=Roseicyclus elongatus DSM 19469 TaxID=1294273 RepID=W8S711_9RHOB|nr:PQQ-dependent oxidoreductase, gdhB family [Roseibacterium elongatum DSM 19469]
MTPALPHRAAPTLTLTVILSLSLPAAVPAQPVADGPPNRPGTTPAFAAQTEAPEQISGFELARETVATGLERPWAVAVLPDGAGYLVTERPGRVRHVSRAGAVSDPIAGVPEVLARRQGGLLDVALSPDFMDNRVIFLTYARPMGDGLSATAAARAVLSEDLSRLNEVTEIFVQTPPSPTPMHYGSRILPVGDHVFVTTGERFTDAERALAQDPAATYGTVVRLLANGDIPAGNPFAGTEGARPEIWSLGHRNIQGAALHPETGDLWTIEHGPAGGDELNRIEPGANYGWPVVSYGVNYDGSSVGLGEAAHAPDFTEPRYYWDPVIAPGGDGGL